MPQTIRIPNAVQIAMAGDWGTGDWRTAANPAPSTDVQNHMAFLQPHLTIHLGVVYYAGTGDQEKHLLVDLWPKGSLGALTLNSNHEMYSGAKPYFEEALGSSLFGIQQGRSFFALENDDWVIVGLDSAYYSDAEGLYMDGALFQDGGPQLQLDFLKQQAAKSKKTIVLTHHNGLTEDGSTTTNLWSQVMSASPDGTAPAYWYWGHVHAGVVYQPRSQGTANVLCRCCGHTPCRGVAPRSWRTTRISCGTSNASPRIRTFLSGCSTTPLPERSGYQRSVLRRKRRRGMAVR